MSELIEQFKEQFKAIVVDAAECAVKIQKDLKTRNAELPDNRRMEFRIGINLFPSSFRGNFGVRFWCELGFWCQTLNCELFRHNSSFKVRHLFSQILFTIQGLTPKNLKWKILLYG